MKRAALKRETKLRAVSKKPGYVHEKKALDALCRKIVFARDPYCQRCRKVENGQWCHVTSRRFISLRWRLENSLRLCNGCHLWWHHRPLAAAEWFRAKFPVRYNALALMSSSPQKVDLKLERAWLEAEARKMGVL